MLSCEITVSLQLYCRPHSTCSTPSPEVIVDRPRQLVSLAWREHLEILEPRDDPVLRRPTKKAEDLLLLRSLYRVNYATKEGLSTDFFPLLHLRELVWPKSTTKRL